LSRSNLFNSHHDTKKTIGSIIKRNSVFIQPTETLRIAVEKMAKENVDILPVVLDNKIIGILTYQHIISVYNTRIDENEKKQAHITLNRQRLRMLIRGQKLISILKKT